MYLWYVFAVLIILEERSDEEMVRSVLWNYVYGKILYIDSVLIAQTVHWSSAFSLLPFKYNKSYIWDV